MEAALFNISNDKIQKQTLSLNQESEGLPITKDKELILNKSTRNDLNTNNNNNDHVSAEPEKSSKTHESPSEKSASPTLIEHAFKVVKNLFSPDKNRSKPANTLSLVSQQRSPSESPCNSVYIPSKPDFHNSKPGVEISNVVQVSENKEHTYMNQLGLMFDVPSHDIHNNTDNSFFTPTSSINESFQSTVTHLDENGEALKNVAGSFLNYSRNLNLSDSENENETLENSDFILENTMFNNVGLGLDSTKIAGGKMDGLDKRPFVNGELGNPEKFFQRNFCDEDLKENCMNAANKINEPQKNQGLPISQNSNKDPDKTIQSRVSPTNFYGKEKCVQMENIFLNKSFENCADGTLGFDPSNPADETRKQENKEEEKPDSEEIIPEINLEELSGNQELPIESSISTTTVILNAVESVDLDSMLLSLKAEDSETNTSSLTSFEGNDEIEGTILENRPPHTVFNEKQPHNTTELISEVAEDLLNKSECHSSKKSSAMSEHKLNISSGRIRSRSKSPTAQQKLVHDIPGSLSSVEMSQDRNCEVTKRSLDLHPRVEESSVISNDQDLKTILSLQLVHNNEKTGEDFEILSRSEFGKSEVDFASEETDAATIVSQQSYTVLHSYDNVLNRPVINSTEDFGNGLVENALNEKNNVFDPSKEPEPKEKLNELSDISSENIVVPKQSTPIYGGNNVSRILRTESSGSNKTFVKPSSLCLQSPDIKATDSDPILQDDYNKPSLLEKAMQIFSSKEESVDFSPVTPVKGSTTFFSESEEKVKRKEVLTDLNCTFSIPSEAKQPVDVKIRSPNLKSSKKKYKSPGAKKNNQTFDIVCGSPKVTAFNQTFVKSDELSLKETLGQAIDRKSESPVLNKMNQTFNKKTESPKLSKTNEKVLDVSIQNSKGMAENEFVEISGSQVNQPDSKKNDPISTSQFSTSEVSSKPPLVDDTVEFVSNKDAANESFISTTSSNTSFLCNGNATVLINQKQVGSDGLTDEDLVVKTEELNLREDIQKEFTEKSFNVNKAAQCANSEESKNDSSAFFRKMLLQSNKIQCDEDLIQLIQEQFSTTDIEKICSVVDDLSSMKLNCQILNANEQFEKSFHGSLCNDKAPLTEEFQTDKLADVLTPQSFDFLNSIKGKPTGRDLSRESLYVKFDPLVQVPNATSLIDFTKEAETLATIEASVTNNSTTNVCEQLLAISPEKKSDEIVPPLTPLSNKNKVQEDKTEKVKELQNEIYFLKNLYAEREKANKIKMDNFESQIAKLTGENCIMEEKLKESNEREKSLVKKMKEQTQNISQLTVIMDGYVKAISKLTAELESLRNESANKIKALTADKDSYVTHLQNTEAAFTDVHAKYEKSKKTIVNLKANETVYRNTIAEQSQKLEELKGKAIEAQEKAGQEFQKIQEELNEAKSYHRQETAKLKAQLRKTELKLEAVRESLSQKIKENEQLTAICDELIEEKK